MTHFTPAADADLPWTGGRVLRYAVLARGRGRLLALGTAGLMSHQICEALVPVVIGLTIDNAVLTGDTAALVRWLAALAVLFVVLTFSWRIGARRLIRVVSYGSHDLRLLATQRVLDPQRPPRRRPAGEVLSITSSDADRVAEFTWVIAQTAAVCAGLATATAALLAMSVPLGLAVLITAPAVLLAMHVLARPLEHRSDTEQDQAARAGALAADLVQGVRVLKGIGAEGAAADRYRTVSRASMTSALRAARAKAGYDGLGEVLSDIVLAAVALAAGALALNGHLQIGELVTVVGLAQFVRGPMTALGRVGVTIAQKVASARRVAALLNRSTEPVGHRSSTPAPPPVRAPAAVGGPPSALLIGGPGDGAPAISVRSGEIVGMLDSDPAHTERLLAALTAGVPTEPGEITVLGKDLAEMTATEVRRLIFVADRDAVLFSGTLAENLHAGCTPGVVDEQAVRSAAADDVLTHLAQGLSTVLVEQGRNLSGGQRQRILLARALHRDQPILVLHEPTTAVDSVTQARIGAALRRHPRTAILLITSSPALLAACDRVVSGGAAGWTTGTHAELLATDSRYREAVRA
jgi:ABC-type multidrug transport system fused ATPase/permease subunit